MAYVITQNCCKDASCVPVCLVDCIRPAAAAGEFTGSEMLYIDPEACIDCGACLEECPVEAIYYEDDVPEQWAEYYKANVEFFDDLGSPGGAAKLGMIPKDHPIIADLPPQEHDE